MTEPSEAHARVDPLVAEVGVVAAGGQLGVAALLYTYQCTIACRHCCFGCATDRPHAHMSTPQAVGHLHSLHELGRVIHIAGGECMMYWDDLRSVLEQAHAERVEPHFIETNCSFATDDAAAAERLDVLEANGVVGLLMSADPYHQAFVPPERFLRVRRMARERFGPENVWCAGGSDDEVRDLVSIGADEARLREYVRAHPPRMVGTAHRELRQYLDAVPVGRIPPGHGWRFAHDGSDCGVEFDAERIWEVHIDPYNNVQTNCGVILGNTDSIGLAEVMARGPANANFVTKLLAEGGPVALAEYARDKHGFIIPSEVVSKCDLCYNVRKFLRPFHPEVLGPAEVY